MSVGRPRSDPTARAAPALAGVLLFAGGCTGVIGDPYGLDAGVGPIRDGVPAPFDAGRGADARPGTADARPGEADAARPVDARPAIDAAPPGRPLPTLSGLTVNCSAYTISNTTRAREIYDEYLGDRLPTTNAGFGWQAVPDVLSEAILERVVFGRPQAGLSEAEYHNLWDFDDGRYSRRTDQSNWDIFGAIGGGSLEPYQKFNPEDWSPGTSTYYARYDTNDVMANQFVYRVACNRAEMEDAFTRCPTCDDVMTALSCNDMYRIFELRFVRLSGGTLEVSRVFRTVSVDCSGDMIAHSQYGPLLFATVGGTTYWGQWRMEMSGRLYQIVSGLGVAGGAAKAVMIRSSTANP